MRRTGRKRIDRLQNSPVSAVDLFCGAGGLTYGLRRAGIRVEAGIDIDEQAEHAFRVNNPGVEFLRWDVSRKYCPSIAKLFRPGAIRLLAGCAPCKPFSRLTNGGGPHEDWNLLDNFGRYVRGLLPELVTMENVPELADRGSEVFERFVGVLRSCGYHTDWKVVRCEDYGVPQSRRRLVLLASRISEIHVPNGGQRSPSRWKTVRDAIDGLSPLSSGEEDPKDPLHAAVRLTPVNLKRVRATPHDGGTRRSWPKRLVLACHQRSTGKSYGSIYGRMWWDRPGPTMTTLCYGLGNGRFGHPEQDRAITLREAALLQSFPDSYEFWPPDRELNRNSIGRMIGNAVPPKLARALGKALLSNVLAKPAPAGGRT